MGFVYLMQNLAQERLGIAVTAVSVAEAAIEWTLEYTRSRKAFGQPIAHFQHSKFLLAELHTEVQVARAYLDRCIELHLEGKLSAEQSAAAKEALAGVNYKGYWDGGVAKLDSASATLSNTLANLPAGPLALAVGAGFNQEQFQSKPSAFKDASKHANDIVPRPTGAKATASTRVSAMADLCHVLLNANEFVYVD